MTTAAQVLMQKRCDRTIAVILSYKEKECDRYLPDDIRKGLRKVILDQVNDLYNLYCDLTGAETEQTEFDVINELFVEKLEAIYTAVTNGQSS